MSVGVEVLREAPVDHDGLAEVADQHVAGLEIAVDDPLAVRVRDRVARGGEARNDREPVLELRRLGDHLVERPARHQLHREERLAGRPAAGLVDRHDAGVLQARGDQRLALEPRDLVAGRIEQLTSARPAAEPAILGGDDLAHAAARDLAVACS